MSASFIYNIYERALEIETTTGFGFSCFLDY